MRPQKYIKLIVSGFTALSVITILVYLTLKSPPGIELLPQSVLFLLLVVTTTLMGVPLGGGMASLLPMAVVATYLSLGLVPAGWIALLGELISEALEPLFQDGEAMERPKGRLEQATRLATNITLQPASILIAGALYQQIGGSRPLVTITSHLLIPFIALGLTYLLVSYLGAGVFFAGRGREWLESYLSDVPRMLTYEGLPLFFAPWVALVVGCMGTASLGVLVLGLVGFAWVARNLAFARQRLERRVRELDVLQKVGRALSTNLNLEDLLQAIYTQVAGLMPANYFYISLYDPDLNEVSFPFVIEDGQRTSISKRRTGAGLTEHVLHTGQPLLSRTNTAVIRQQLGLPPARRPAASWLGVPVIVGNQTIGVIALQSYEARNLYDEGHQNVLAAVASQAGIAIQNARLFSRTDRDLNLRFRQLDSVLKAAQDGMLLLDRQNKVVLSNRAAVEFLGLAQLSLMDLGLDQDSATQIQLLAERLGYPPGKLDEDFSALLAGVAEYQRQMVSLPLAPGVAIERTLLPVRERDGTVTGWLFVLHDRTQEVRLAAMQEDMVEMMVHDLRSPLAIIQGGLEVIEQDIHRNPVNQPMPVLAPLKRSTQRMLRLVNDMLEIHRLEEGELLLQTSRVPVRPFLEEIASQYTSLVEEPKISLLIEAPSDLPALLVDVEHTGRVLHNLLDNAIKFTPDAGSITLAARLEPTLNGDFVRLTVQDTGAGIPSGAQADIFHKYSQLEGAPGRRRGSGLGLYYCRLVLEAHGGKIWVESPPGQGASFHLLLPALVEAHVA
jgi:signal transduction histidine kinase